MTMGKTTRPPYRSVQIPRKIRLNDPVRIGVATRRPNSVSFKPKSSLIWMPMIENIVQAAKQTAKEKVLSERALFCGPVSAVVSVMASSDIQLR